MYGVIYSLMFEIQIVAPRVYTLAGCDINKVIKEPHGEGDSDQCPSDESYFSHLRNDDDNGHDDDDEISSDKVKILKETYTCMRSNMGGNKHATQGWIASVVTDKIKSYGWDDSFIQTGDFKEELENRNPGSVVDIDFEMVGHFKGRFNGVLAAAIGIDGNNGLFLVAYGVLESENGTLGYGTFCFQPVLDLVDNIREELLKRFDEKSMVVEKWNGTLVPMASISTLSLRFSNFTVNLNDKSFYDRHALLLVMKRRTTLHASKPQWAAAAVAAFRPAKNMSTTLCLDIVYLRAVRFGRTM
ncbi:hypothetical protein Tco_0046918 [Tanacetum coccineum]